jgi:hypothetical protein
MKSTLAKRIGNALGKRRREQQEMWVATPNLPMSPGHVFYRKLNATLEEAGFDRMLEEFCRPYYADEIGRPGIPPGVYFRMLCAAFAAWRTTWLCPNG